MLETIDKLERELSTLRRKPEDPVLVRIAVALEKIAKRLGKR
jgi:hypothetical protein